MSLLVPSHIAGRRELLPQEHPGQRGRPARGYLPVQATSGNRGAAGVAALCVRRRCNGRRQASIRCARVRSLGVSDVGAAGCVGVVLLNIGTPASTALTDVREYLSRFLGDKPVIDIEDPAEKREILRRIVESGAAKSVESYRRIWDSERGSPLLYHTEDLVAALQEELGGGYKVCIGFQYSEPSIETALAQLTLLGAAKIVLVPMFPHFAQATVGACLANTSRVAAAMGCKTYLQVLHPFYKNSGYLQAVRDAVAAVVGPQGSEVDHVVFSFHGIPVRQCTSTDATESVCMKEPDCCSIPCTATRNCYRAQCLETAVMLADALDLPELHWSIAFQSRAALRRRIDWTRPFTDELLVGLAKGGARRVAVCSPSYTADCVETLGELGMDTRELFLAAGGEELRCVPCINGSLPWARRLKRMILDLPATAEDAARTSAAGPRLQRGFWAM